MAVPLNRAEEFWMIQAQSFPTPQPVRPRFLMIEGRAREVRSARDIIDALSRVLVDCATGAAGAACEGDLLNVGFTREEIATHLPRARERAARAMRERRV